jgi:hypothetical protein
MTLQDDQIKNNEMSETCNTHQDINSHVLVEESEGKRPPARLGVDGRIILKLVLKK